MLVYSILLLFYSILLLFYSLLLFAVVVFTVLAVILGVAVYSEVRWFKVSLWSWIFSAQPVRVVKALFLGEGSRRLAIVSRYYVLRRGRKRVSGTVGLRTRRLLYRAKAGRSEGDSIFGRLVFAYYYFLSGGQVGRVVGSWAWAFEVAQVVAD